MAVNFCHSSHWVDSIFPPLESGRSKNLYCFPIQASFLQGLLPTWNPYCEEGQVVGWRGPHGENQGWAPIWWPAPISDKWDYPGPSSHLSNPANISWSSITTRSNHRTVRNNNCFKSPSLWMVYYLAIIVFFPKFYYENIQTYKLKGL